jgi:hypothetical protein
MTAAQRTMLFALFAQLAKAMAWGPSQRELQRTQLTVDVFGEALSWSTFTPAHVDRMKRRLVACLRPDDIAAQMADTDEGADAAARERLIFAIERDAEAAGFADAYMAAVATDFYDRADWRALPIPQLTNLRRTIADRLRRAPLTKPRRRRVDVVPDRHA